MKTILVLDIKLEKILKTLHLDILGTGSEYIWEEVTKISDISSESTILYSENLDKDILKNTYDWTSLYGELGSGEYEFILSISDLGFSCIRISFFIDENGEVSYNEPTLGW